MAYRLTPRERIRIDEFVEIIREKHGAVADEIRQLNHLIEQQVEKIDAAIGALDEQRRHAADYVDDIRATHQDAFEASSEAWQNSDRGRSVEQWLNEMASIAEDLQTDTEWEKPADIDADALDDPGDVLENMFPQPEEV